MQGQEDLLEMSVGDKINYIKCISGCDNLREPTEPAKPAASAQAASE